MSLNLDKDGTLKTYQVISNIFNYIEYLNLLRFPVSRLTSNKPLLRLLRTLCVVMVLKVKVLKVLKAEFLKVMVLKAIVLKAIVLKVEVLKVEALLVEDLSQGSQNRGSQS